MLQAENDKLIKTDKNKAKKKITEQPENQTQINMLLVYPQKLHCR